MADAVAIDTCSPMLQPNGQWPCHSPFLFPHPFSTKPGYAGPIWQSVSLTESLDIAASEYHRIEVLAIVPVSFDIVRPPIVGAVTCLRDNPVPSALDRVECMDAELRGSPVTSSSPGADEQLNVFSHDDCASQRREHKSAAGTAYWRIGP